MPARRKGPGLPPQPLQLVPEFAIDAGRTAMSVPEARGDPGGSGGRDDRGEVSAETGIRREGQGRVYVNVLGHHESIYYNNPPLLAHILAGIQYALGDLEAPDAPVPLKR